MSQHVAHITDKTLAWWVGGSVLVASTAVGGVLLAKGDAASATSSGTTSSGATGSGGGNNGNGVGNGPNGAAPPPKALTVDHTVPVEVRLGTPGVLRVVVTNPNNQAVILTGVTGRITSVDTASGAEPACTPSDFDIAPSTATQRIERRSVSDPVDLAVTMVENNANQDRCKGATYHFSLTATANRA